MFGVPYFLTNPFESPWIEPPWFCLRAGPPGGNTFTLAGNKKNQWFGPMSEAGLVGVGRIPQLYTNVSFFLRTLGLWLHLAVPSPSRPSRLFMIGKPGNRWRRINSAQVSSIVEINMVKVMSKCTKPLYRCSMVQRGAWWCSQRFHEGIAPSVKALEHIWANHKAPRRSSQGKAQFLSLQSLARLPHPPHSFWFPLDQARNLLSLWQQRCIFRARTRLEFPAFPCLCQPRTSREVSQLFPAESWWTKLDLFGKVLLILHFALEMMRCQRST